MSSSRRRWLWVCVCGFSASFVVVCALLLAPPVQGWLLRRFVASQPGWKVEFERIGVGPTGADARGLKFSLPGFEASSAPIAVRVALSKMFSQRELRIERVDAQKLRLAVTPAQMPASPPFDGLLKLLQSPLPWALDAANVTGEIDLRSETESRVKGTFVLSGGGVSSQAPGEFFYELSLGSALLSSGGDNPVRSAGTVRMTQDGAQGVARLTLEGDLLFPDLVSGKLPAAGLFVEVVASPKGETYRAHIALGSDRVLEIEASLDAARTELSGQIVFHVARAHVAPLSPRPLPLAQADGKIRFLLNFATADFDADLESAFDLRDWQTLFPQLVAVDALKGHLSTQIRRQAGQIAVPRFTATVQGERSPARASLVLTGPVDLGALPEGPIARIALDRWPAKWAHPVFGSAELGGTWAVALDRTNVVHLTPERPLKLGPLAFPSDLLAPLTPATLTLSPQIRLSRGRQALSIPDLTLIAPTGEYLDATVTLVRENATGDLALKGSVRAGLPTLLAGKTSAFPLVVETTFESQLDSGGAELRLAAFDLTAVPDVGGEVRAALALKLKRPVTLDLAQLAPPRSSAGETDDWLQVTVRQLPLGWASRWLPGHEIDGTLETGEFGLGTTPEGELALRTPIPWTLTDLSFSTEGVNRFRGNATARIAAAWLGNRLSGAIDHLSLAHRSGNRVGGNLGFSVDLAAKSGRAVVALDAEIPSVPEEFKAVGPLQASLRADVQSVSRRFLGATEFALEVRHAAGELFSAKIDEPFIFGLSDNGMIMVSTVAPLPLRLGAMPLEWLRPWTGEYALTGTIAPSQFELSAEKSQFTLRAVSPLAFGDVGVRRGDQDLVRSATFGVTPSAQLTFLGKVEPKLELAYAGSLHLTKAHLDATGARVFELDATLGFKGNDRLVLADALTLTSRLDFASTARLPVATVFNLPARGTLVTRIDGELLGAEPFVLSTRLDGLPVPHGDGELPPLELTLRGNMSREQVFTGGAKVLLSATPTPSDAAFDVTLNLVDGNLAIASGLRSRFLDAQALLDVARVFGGRKSPPSASAVAAPISPVRAESPVVVPVTAADRSGAGPLWATLRGSFDLEIGTIQWGLYRIDRVTGRLDAGDRSLSLRNLGGEMFSGRWGGDVRVDHDPANEAGSHRLQADFRIEQFESARVIQTAFRNQIASIDARLDLRASVSGLGDTLPGLVDRSEAQFALESEKGVMRLAVPKSDRLATAAVFGGSVLLSPELRALGRLLRKFAEMPVDRLTIGGRRTAAGEISLDQFRFDSPQVSLLGHGRVAALANEPLMNRPLELSLQLAAKDELAVILGGMKLLEKTPAPNGFRAMRQPVILGGRVGEPDTSPFYDLLAKAVGGSRGTWGFLMRKVQSEVKKKTPPPP